MQKFFAAIVLVCGLLFCRVGGVGAETEKDSIKRAADLSQEAWSIIDPDRSLIPPNYSLPTLSETDSKSPWYANCDAEEVAQPLFRQAVELNPALAEAWRGLGQVTEQLGRCSTANAGQWLERNWLGSIMYKESKARKHIERIAPILTAAYADAETMYKKAAEIDPQDYRNWLSWGEILLLEATFEKDAAKRRELLALASKNYRLAAELNPDDPEMFLTWGRALLAMLPLENDTKGWAAILNEAKDSLTRYVDLSPLENPEKDGFPENPKASAWSRFADMLIDVNRRHDLQPDLIKSLRELSLECWLQAQKLSPDSEDRTAYLGVAHLRLAAVEEEAKVWREHLARAKEYHIQSFQQYKKKGDGIGLWISDGWLELTSHLDNGEKRQAFASEALDIFDKLGLEGAQVLGSLSRFSSSLKFRSWDKCDEPPTTKYFLMMHISSLLPSGPERDKILAECEANLNNIISQIGRNKRIVALQHWGEILLGLAAVETDSAKYESLVKKSRQKYQLAADEAADVGDVLQGQAWGYQFAFGEAKDLSRKRDFAISAIKCQEQALTLNPGRLELLSLARMYYRLPELDKALSGQRECYRDKVIKLTLKAAELQDQDLGIRHFWDEKNYFIPAQLLVVFSMDYRKRRMSWDFDRPYLAQAMGLYRRAFHSLPDLSDRIESAGRPTVRTTHWMKADGKNPETYQYHVTKKVADMVRQLIEVCDPQTMDAWDLTQLAGLHRYLVASGMLTPEYRLLYWQRAEKMLRQAMDMEAETAKALENAPLGPPPAPHILDGAIYDLTPGQSRPKNRAQQEGKICDLTLAMSELGLLLSERTLWDDDQKAARLKEAEELWGGAEKMRPGSSLYARARWAAWRGDLETLKKNLTHNRNDTLALLYPSLEEARDDPALAGYVNEHWFRQCWYGFGFTGEASSQPVD